ncbi:unnamed protein product [Caenorhabditis angaria]|uniref:isoleucine--tRNA ligase n=1 Tax=Caenorhabditis angaria TaxID=860376 RepID=A0A9P1I6J9_9PELO|nr:unnamed protein product [Caenorhabditis angaria]
MQLMIIVLLIDIMILNTIGKIGQVIEVTVPPEVLTSGLSAERVEYSTKPLLGTSHTPGIDLFIRRLVIAYTRRNKCKDLLFTLGVDHDAGIPNELIAAALVAFGEEAPVLPNIFLPTAPNFSNHIKSTERALNDQNLSISGGLDSLYTWQAGEVDRPVFEILDGPPYANGEAHTGHAINKVLKDFVVKSRVGLGYRVIFRPGWDCHGLPIELKIAKSTTSSGPPKWPLEIRESARQIADESIGKQMNAFKRWGISADWKDPYITKSEEYIGKQLRCFGVMVEKGMVQRRFKPVYWSPSSNTALAESELEYNEKHQSTAAYFRFKMINLSENDVNWASGLRPKPKPAQFYALTWTTTPWTLPLNNAICVSKKIEYCVIEFEDEQNNPTSNFYICAKNLIPQNFDKNRKFRILGEISAENLIGRKYVNCWYNELAMPIYEGEHVLDNIGTGLVHTSYAHGFQDYEIALSQNEKVESFVDSQGCYTRQMGHQLSGQPVLGQGQKLVLEILGHDVVHVSKYTHSYPYDWRTKKPVIIRASQQWFIDLENVGKQAEEALENTENVRIFAGETDLRAGLKSLVSSRKNWCISRQRVWGTPIPALINRETEEAWITKELVEYVAKMVEKEGVDWWWKVDVETICEAMKMEKGLYSKNQDIMDVWLDSGLAWAAARKDPDVQKSRVDLVLEGVDQFRGWFQSLLLTSIAIKNQIPYENVIVHGFCIDEKNQKMSKSIGNVVDPMVLTDGSLKQKAIGADGLRFWVALGGSENAGESKIGQKVVEDVDKKIIALRNGFRFMIGGSFGYTKNLWKPEKPSDLRILDQDILYNLSIFGEKALKNYENFKFRTVANDLIQFMARNFSANYVKYVRDRLYCDKIGSPAHLSAQFTLHTMAHDLSHLISPILPHLSSEVLRELPDSENLILRQKINDVLYNFQEVSNDLPLIYEVRNRLEIQAGPKIDTSKKAVLISVEKSNDFEVLNEILRKNELCELLNVSQVRLTSDEDLEHSVDIQIQESDLKYCERCRKHQRDPMDSLCIRCAQA